MLDVLPVVVDHVERSVGTDGREHRLEPGVGGGQELPFLEGPAGGEGRSRGGEQVAVHQVVQRVADEIGASEPLRKPGGGVDGVPATGGEYAHLGFVDVDGISRDGIDDGLVFVIGGKLHGGGDLQVGILRQVTVRDDGMADVVVVPQGEAVAGGVEGVAVLRVPGNRLQLQPVRPEAEVGAQSRDVDGRNFRMAGKVQRCSRQSELFGVAPRGSHLGVGPVDPVVDAVQESVDSKLGIVAVESAENHSPFVGPQVAVQVGKIEDVRSGGHQHPLLPRHQSGGKGQLLRQRRGGGRTFRPRSPPGPRPGPGVPIASDSRPSPGRRGVRGRRRRRPPDPRPGARPPPARSRIPAAVGRFPALPAPETAACRRCRTPRGERKRRRSGALGSRFRKPSSCGIGSCCTKPLFAESSGPNVYLGTFFRWTVAPSKWCPSAERGNGSSTAAPVR